MKKSKESLENLEEVSSRPGSDESAARQSYSRPSNPFRIPDDKEQFQLHETMRNSMKKSRSRLLDIQPNRENFRHLTQVTTQPISAEEKALDALIPAPDSSKNREGLREFISQKREIFLAQLAIDTKREELQRLEKLEKEEEAALKAKAAEINLFKTQFANFIESDGKATMEARSSAERKSKERLQVSMKIKQVSSQISTLRNEIAHQDEKLAECQQYQQFLESLTPPDWRAAHPNEMYFKDPEQLITIIISLEEQNMFLIRHCQEAEEAVERYRAKFNDLLQSREGGLKEMMNNKEEKEKELMQARENNGQYKTDGAFHYGNELNDDEYNQIQQDIIIFHKSLGFDIASSTDISMMLRRIENKMEQLILKLEKAEPSHVKALALEKERERRDLKRTKDQEEKQQAQAEKVRKAIELANKPIERKLGRPVVERIIPKKGQTRQEEEDRARKEMMEKEADEQLLFGQIWD
ncbi:hypothetical protein TVAG_027290 [Trichomonas vaginalis G3]|uniref:DUF4200 domain-containing protein n=1 Tax=Trichomonas vaginalis (strain ATCC PRA-98 / G3) TaxID=412133 RepID=A2F1H4_TRIV3|nr:inner dynein arm assembly [Trichomonas vaginalis G3]EAY01261.1 hypothetical protein TVAG_027290 [Trichomonas vaginalis G3]KAI5487002.1 inner dynein arm assembly [Trichomonas vaginalis G3]|eukprot:XP_001314076.1 hypothetical protein [Trichomonas vaginalis G3]